ncbi:lectin-like isoform X3 [Erpetoichthys calabaricus]|uniref:lectin-like isoform X2 n=1 Tax=Erpetoichthys calabaricus TaxID=27687 RepID=UPI002234106C|nr:lectin-like isoform X2 [Erpetoichthys calabaricus]XP_051787823.1 lectin-like isoform X3 [Erpetoichthys calabaricus]
MAVTLGLLLAAFIISTVTDVSYGLDSCEPGWVSYSNKCYQYFPMRKAWIDAELYCISLGGNLASVHSSIANQFITSLIRSRDSSGPSSWLGGSNCVRTSSWLWTDGSQWDFTNWNPFEPNNVGGNEKCFNTNFMVQGGWNDIDCSNQYPFVCMKNKPLKPWSGEERSHERH